MNTRKMLNKPKLPFVLQTDLQTIDENTTAERARALSQQIEALYDAYYANSTLEGEHSWYDMHQRDHDALIELEEVVRASSKPPLDVGLVAGFRNKDWRNDYLAPMQMVSVQDHRRNEIFTGIIAGKVQGNNVQVILLRDGGGIAPSWVLKSNITPVKEEEDLARLSKFYATTIAKIRKQIAPAESDKKPEYQISNNEKESANAQNDGNQRMWFCLAADGQLVILGDHSDFDAAEDAATSSGVEAIWIFDRITADSWVSTLTSPEAKMSLRDDCYPSAAEIIDVEYLIDSELIEHSERIWRNAAGKLHRKDGPAIERANGDKEWYQNGELHRENGPATEYANGDKIWWLNGKTHRKDGPAIERANGDRYGINTINCIARTDQLLNGRMGTSFGIDTATFIVKTVRQLSTQTEPRNTGSTVIATGMMALRLSGLMGQLNTGSMESRLTHRKRQADQNPDNPGDGR